ncbi:MAG: S1 RNA-binding domain-containing protein [Planctomycetes bacterium]|nr:S1 RNA-binding domain-containing protein [Planctomycetota bacterium]
MSNGPSHQDNDNLPSTRTDNPDRTPPRKIGKYDMNKAGDMFKAGNALEVQPDPIFDQPSLLSKIDNDAFIERELEAAMMGITETDLMGGGPMPRRKKGQEPLPQMKLGKVFRIHDQDVFIDLPGGIKQGVLSILSFPEGNPVIGQEVEVKIEGFDSANGVMLLSRKGSAVSNANWNTVAVGMTVEARVTGVNKGGLEVDVHGIRGFMPISQIEIFRINELEPYLNQKLICMVSEVDVASQNLVVSRRDILEKEKAEAKEKLWLELKEGQVREGIVRSVMQFGAFVDLGGVDGLLHISEMSWSRQVDATKLFQSGQKVKVIVLKIDPETRKVGLGFKQLEENPWDVFSRDNRPGAIVTGKVTKLAEFGAFIELSPGIEGLVHLSELSSVRVRRAQDVLKVGQEVQVKIQSMDSETKRISLSIKALTAPEASAAEPAEPEPVTPSKPVRPAPPRNFSMRGGIGDSGNKPLF